MKKKNELRMGVIFSIAMFLLLPLLSSPVAAAFTENLGLVTTGNTGGGGPTATGSITSPGTVPDSAPFNANIAVEYDYNDNDAAGSGSNHWMVIVVKWQPVGTGPWSGPNTYTQTKIYIAANGGQRTGTYTTTTITGYGGTWTVFDVNVTVYCDDLSGSGPVSWNSGNIFFTII